MNHKNLTKSLYEVLTNSYALALKTQNYHWNVVGSNFKSLHELFGLQYEELSTAIDEIAERIRALDCLVPAGLVIFSEAAEIKDGDEKLSSDLMIKNLLRDQEILLKIITAAIRDAQDNQDEATADMLIGRLEIHSKNRWMLKSSL